MPFGLLFMTITSFEIKYETAANVPPPYCYYYHIRCEVTLTGLITEFSWVYHNREGLSQEEIEEEGFTGQDDFAWEGTLATAWLAPIGKLLRRTRQSTKADNETVPFLEMDFRTQQSGGFHGSPDTIVEWDYFLQEFIQSIYETSGKEAPLLIRYKKITPQVTLFCSIRMQFKDRTVSLQTRLGDAKMQQRQADWDEMKQVLEPIFALSYITEAAESREPHQPGTYLNAGENSWYEFDKTVINPSSKIDTLAQVSQVFDKLTR